jgi:RNA 3'-terminal phosphate cyclase-like protein
MLRFRGSQQLRQRLVLATLTGRTIRIDAIRDGSAGDGDGDGNGTPATFNGPRGLRPHEASLLRLIEKISSGCVVEINETGTSLRYKPGVIVGGTGVAHDCSGTGRGIGYFLEPLLLLALFAKRPLSATLKGITNGPLDPSVDTIRNVTLPLVRRLAGLADTTGAPIGGVGAATGPNALELKVVSRGAPPLGGGEVYLRVPVVRSLPGVGGEHGCTMTDEGMVRRVRGVAYTARVSPQAANRAVDACRGVLNALLADVYVFTDAASGAASGKSPGFGMTLVAETTSGCLVSAEACAAAPRKAGTGAAAAAALGGAAVGGEGKKRRRGGGSDEEDSEDEDDKQRRRRRRQGSDEEEEDDDAAANALTPAAPTSAREAQRQLLRAQDALVVPEDVGATAARRLLEEVSRGGVVDGAHQPLLLTMAALAPRGEMQTVRLGPLTPPAVRALRDLKAFLGVVYTMKPETKSRTVVMSCMGVGLVNANRKAT